MIGFGFLTRFVCKIVFELKNYFHCQLFAKDQSTTVRNPHQSL